MAAVVSAGRTDQVELSFSKMMEDVEAGRVAKVTITGSEIVGEYNQPTQDGQAKRFLTYAPAYDDLVKDLRRYNVAIEAKKPREPTYLVTILSWLPMLAIFREPLFIVVICIMSLQFFNWMAVLNHADLSFAQPFTAA